MQRPFVVNNLCCQRQEAVLFTELSFELDAGNMLLIEGANGSGKSSLLRLLAGLVTPATGDILWHGNSIFNIAAEYKRQLHYVGHSNGLLLDLTVAENLEHADQATLTSLQLHEHIHVFTRTLSAGQKRKVALAKLFLSQKKLWLLDEPLTALDTDTQALFLIKLQQHLQQGGIAIVSSHQPLALPAASMKVLRLS